MSTKEQWEAYHNLSRDDLTYLRNYHAIHKMVGDPVDGTQANIYVCRRPYQATGLVATGRMLYGPGGQTLAEQITVSQPPEIPDPALPLDHWGILGVFNSMHAARHDPYWHPSYRRKAPRTKWTGIARHRQNLPKNAPE